MRRVLLIMMAVCLSQMTSAQPQARRQQQQAQQAQARKTNADNMTTRAQISFPTQAKMSDDVDWRRDVYREINLLDDANAGLYYPKTVVGSQMNLFAYMFKLVLRGQLKAYEYRVDGNEVFTDSARIKPLQFLDDQGILYTRSDRGMRIDDSDIPSEEVTKYYVKESTYYNQRTATFHTKVQALCPIRVMDGGMETRALFWVKYDDLAPFLSKQTMMTSNLNNAATMSIDDFFTKAMYKGEIYKTNNMQGNMLASSASTGDNIYFGDDVDDFGDPVASESVADSARVKARQEIESQIKSFEKNMWGNQARKDSLDSIAKLDVKDKKALKRQKRGTTAGTSAAKSSTVKASKQRSTKTKSPSPSSGTARVSVRRERH